MWPLQHSLPMTYVKDVMPLVYAGKAFGIAKHGDKKIYENKTIANFTT